MRLRMLCELIAQPPMHAEQPLCTEQARHGDTQHQTPQVSMQPHQQASQTQQGHWLRASVRGSGGTLWGLLKPEPWLALACSAALGRSLARLPCTGTQPPHTCWL